MNTTKTARLTADAEERPATSAEPGSVTSEGASTTHPTTAPVEPGPIGSPEFIRIGDARRLFGLGRSYCYTLIAEGKIRSVSLRKRGAKTGVRLLDVASVREFLRGVMEKAE